jgi:hypothetical protein
MKRTDLRNIMIEAHRFIRIAGISLSEALRKAWANFKLKLKMSAGIVKFYYQKINGEIREAYGTLCNKYLPFTESTAERKKCDYVQAYFDTEAQSWRSYKKMNVINF